MEKKEIIIFSTLAIAVSSLICFIAYQLDNPGISILSVFTPAIVALVMTAATTGKKGLTELFVKQTSKKMALKWLLLSLFGIPAIALLAMLTSLDFDASRFHLRTTQLLPQVVVIILIAIGEEYGWRGYILPRLMKKVNVLYASIILGLIWGFWHFPAYLIGAGVPLQMDFYVFLSWVVLGTLFMSWLYYYTKSVLTSILAHVSANAAFNYLVILPEFTGNTNTFWWLIGYMSVLMMIVYTVGRKDLVKG